MNHFHFNEYKTMLNDALDSINVKEIMSLETQLLFMAVNNYPVLVCGNGGSAAITEHMSCDHTKGIVIDTNLRPFVIPLQSNVSLCTAIANDIGYEYIFSKQIEWYSNNKFGVLVVSSSGNSPNVINALLAAKEKNIVTMAMVGFDGGRVKELADICVHVKSDNYGIIEDAHQIIMHSIAQSIRINSAKKGASLKL